MESSSPNLYYQLETSIFGDRGSRKNKEYLYRKRRLNHEKSIYEDIKKNNVESVKNELKKGETLNNEIVGKMDALGATIIHCAYVWKKFKICRWLVENFPCEAVKPYSGDIQIDIEDDKEEIDRLSLSSDDMVYAGENILHITIAQRNMEETRWLLEHYRERVQNGKDNGELTMLLMGNTTGAFFSKEGNFNCGCYPLHFAVCSEMPELFDLVLSYYTCKNYKKASSTNNTRLNDDATGKLILDDAIFMRDHNGNTCLHLAVIHNLPRMYEHIENKTREIIENRISNAYASHVYEKSDKKLDENHVELLKPALRPLPAVPTDDYDLRELIYHKKHFIGKFYNYKSKIKELKERNNGFYFGYSLIETPIVVPKNKDHYSDWLYDATTLKLLQRMVLVLNEDFHSPLTLAAAGVRKGNEKETEDEKSARKSMFTFMINRMKRKEWDYGKISCSWIHLEGLDLPHNYKKYNIEIEHIYCHSGVVASMSRWSRNTNTVTPDKLSTKTLPPLSKLRWQFRGAIDWICMKESSSYLLTIPEIKGLIQHKWNNFGYPIFIDRFRWHLFVTISITVLACLVNSVPNPYPNSASAYVVSILYPILACIFGWRAIEDLPSICRNGWAHWGLMSKHVARGAVQFDEITRTIQSVSFTALCAAQYSVYSSANRKNDPESLNIKLALTCCVVSSWVLIYYFLMAFDITGGFVLTIDRVIRKDLPFFFMFYTVSLIAFAAAISTLTNHGDDLSLGYGFLTFGQAARALLDITVSVGTLFTSADNVQIIDPNIVPPDLKWLFEFLLTSFYLVVNILMLNLLIAMVNNRYSDLEEQKETLVLTEKYNIMSNYVQCYAAFELQWPFGYIHKALSKIKGTRKFLGLRKWNELAIDYADDLTGKNAAAEAHDYCFEYQEIRPDMFAKPLYCSNDSNCITLLIVDPQNDFHDFKIDGNTPSLPVPGSLNDSHRIRDLIIANIDHIDTIIVTLDTHQREHIAHSRCWINKYKKHPEPHEKISFTDIDTKRWKLNPELSWYKASPENARKWCRDYTKKLEMLGKFQLTIWPDHCLVEKYAKYPCNNELDSDVLNVVEVCPDYLKLRSGDRLKRSEGHKVTRAIEDALQVWTHRKRGNKVKYILKGLNNKTEMYSAVRAEVPDPEDPTTALNVDLLRTLKNAGHLLVCGQARSHCVKNTIEDIVKYWPKQRMSQLVLLEDGCSDVTGYKEPGEAFVAEMRTKGLTVLDCNHANSYIQSVKSIGTMSTKVAVAREHFKPLDTSLGALKINHIVDELKRHISAELQLYTCMLRKKVTLFIVDPQLGKSESRLSESDNLIWMNNSLLKSSKFRRICDFIDRNRAYIDEIIVTLETKQKSHITHPCSWIRGELKKDNTSRLEEIELLDQSDDGSEESDNSKCKFDMHPLPYTTISYQDLTSEKWMPNLKLHDSDWCHKYLKTLDKRMAGGRPLMIWPEQCLVEEGITEAMQNWEVGPDYITSNNLKFKRSEGHKVEECIDRALCDWEKLHGRHVTYVLKGMNTRTEMYSAFRAEVPVIDDPSTLLNTGLLNRLTISDSLLICGQGLGHGLTYTIRDLYQNWPQNNLSSLVVLEDACTDVCDTEEDCSTFRGDLEEKWEGVTVTTCDDMSRQLEGSLK